MSSFVKPDEAPGPGRDSPPAIDPRRLTSRAVAMLQEALAVPLEPGLYIVSTPIGNLADMTLRALTVLARADIVLAEDTRHSRKLMTHFGLPGELAPYHEHNAAKERPRIVARIRAGHSVALVADAGTPLISDPGYKLARAALDQGLRVVSVPGPSAALAALTGSGMPSDHFFFAGFTSPKRETRRRRLGELAAIPSTLILFEAPSRLVALLEDAADVLGERQAAVVKEVTKLHEAVLRGTLSELAALVREGFAERGEFVVLIGPPLPAAVDDDRIVARLSEALARQSLRDAAREVAEELGINRTRVYRIGLAMKEEGGK